MKEIKLISRIFLILGIMVANNYHVFGLELAYTYDMGEDMYLVCDHVQLGPDADNALSDIDDGCVLWIIEPGNPPPPEEPEPLPIWVTSVSVSGFSWSAPVGEPGGGGSGSDPDPDPDSPPPIFCTCCGSNQHFAEECTLCAPPCECCGEKPCACKFCPDCGKIISFLMSSTGNCGEVCNCHSDPCIGAENNIEYLEFATAAWFMDESSTVSKLDELSAMATLLTEEKGAVLLYNSGTYTYRSSDWAYGGQTGVDIPYVRYPGERVLGSIHNHPKAPDGKINYAPPSAGDLYNIAGDYTFVMAWDGSEYCLYIEDHNKYLAFKNAYPQADYVDANSGFTQGTSIWIDIDKVKGEFNYEKALGFVLEKYNTGIVLLKGNNGIFNTEVHVVEGENSKGDIVYDIRDCSN